MKLLKPLPLVLILAPLFSALSVTAQDHPLVTVYPGSKLEDRKAVAFDEFKFPAGKMWAGKFVKELPLEGKIEHLKYRNPAERSTLEMFRNYETSLKQAGFQTIFSCSKEECGDSYTDTQVGHFATAHDTRFIAVKLPRPEGDVYVVVNISGQYNETYVTIVEVRAMDANMSGRAPAPSSVQADVVPTRSAEAPPAAPPAAPRTSSSRGGTKQVVTGVVKGLSVFGIQAKAGSASDQADIIVEGEVETNPFQGNDARIKWARTTATISLRDGRTSKIFTQFNVTDKQGSGDYNEAVRRSQAEMSKKVAAQINTEIAAYFENQ